MNNFLIQTKNKDIPEMDIKKFLSKQYARKLKMDWRVSDQYERLS